MATSGLRLYAGSVPCAGADPDIGRTPRFRRKPTHVGRKLRENGGSSDREREDPDDRGASDFSVAGNKRPVTGTLVQSEPMSDRDRASTLHRALKTAVRAKRAADHRVAVLLAEMEAGKHYQELGHVTLVDYARAEHELTRRDTKDLLRVGQSLRTLPELDKAMAEGRIDISKARELVRVVTPATEAAWVERCEPLTSREIERMVSSVSKGSPPPEKVPPAELGLHRQRLVLEMESTDLQLVLAAKRLRQSQARADGLELDDSAAVADIFRFWLEHHEEDAAPANEVPFRVVIQAEPSGQLRTGDNEVSQTMGEQALCDAELVDMSEGPSRGHVTRTVPPARRAAVLARDDYRCVVPGCSNRRWLELHHLKAWAWGGGHGEANLATVCNGHHRLLHEGTLALERLPDGSWRVEYASGKILYRPPKPEGVREPTTAPPYGVPSPWRAAMSLPDG
jgi:hypothetical protein